MVCALMAVSGYGQNFGTTGIRNTYEGVDYGAVPGVDHIDFHINTGYREHSQFEFPKNKSLVRCTYGDGKNIVYMKESEFTKDKILIMSSAFMASHHMYNDSYNHGVAESKNLTVVYNLEWTTVRENSTWNNAAADEFKYTFNKVNNAPKTGGNY